MNPLVIKYGSYAAIILAILGFAYYEGYSHEHDKLVAFKAQVEQIAKDQAEQTKLADAKNKEQADESQKSYVAAINSVSDYYRAHPVRLFNSCSGTVPQAANHTQITDDPTPNGYASPFSPELTESLATQLYELQQRLIPGGVEIK